MSHYPPGVDEAQHRHYYDGHFTNSYDHLNQSAPPFPTPQLSGVNASDARAYPGPDVPFPTPMVNYPPLPYSPSSASSTVHQGSGDISLESRPSQQKMHSAAVSTPEANPWNGLIPQRVPRRHRTLKRIGLIRGNFVLENPVPKKLLEICGNDTEREFTHIRYSAATCDPNDFKSDGFSLRQVHYDPPRNTELFIVMTMYNEDEDLFTRSMHGVMKNIAHLCKREKSRTWGKEGWKKVVICIVSDGRAKVNPGALSVIAAMGCYQDGLAKTKIGERAVTAHIYEYTTQICITPSLEIVEKGIVPVQIIFCLKEKNQKKINSHRWFFNAFGPILQPKVCVLLDVGTMPGPASIYHLWKAFDLDPKLGGACGEIVALKGKYGRNLLNPLVAAQNFEYKMSNILDKSLESVFGYISVLPGAFSAYRYIAVQNDRSGEGGPLHKYFLGEMMQGGGGIFTANMYLAEDRILCWELFSKRGCSWTLHYVKSAYAVTDVPDQLPELMSQRRRWLNGSFFAGVHSTFHFYYVYRSSHSPLRKFWIHVEMLFQLSQLIFSWFALANYYIAFFILVTTLEDKTFGFNGIETTNVVLKNFYLGLLMTCFILALGNRPQGSKLGYTLAIIGFAIITIYMTLAAALLSYKSIDKLIKKHKGHWKLSDFLGNVIFRNVILSIGGTLGLYIFASFIFFDPWHMITSLVQYLLMAPSHVNVLGVYAFANVHDVSWGTKGENAASLGTVTTGDTGEVVAVVPDEKYLNELYEDALYVLKTRKPKEKKKVDHSQRQEDYYRNFRTNVLLAWVLTNSLLAILITGTNPSASDGAEAAVAGYMTFLLYSVAIIALVKAVGAALYMITWLFVGE